MLQLTACYLKQAGFDVLIATSGPEAERIVRERGPELALCVLDSVMPGFGGEGVQQVMRELGLTTPVLFMTGQDSRRLESALEQEGVALLHKPFGSQELLEQAGLLLHEIEPEAQ